MKIIRFLRLASLLVSCAPEPAMPAPQEVLRKAYIQSYRLQNSAYEATVDVSIRESGKMLDDVMHASIAGSIRRSELLTASGVVTIGSAVQTKQPTIIRGNVIFLQGDEVLTKMTIRDGQMILHNNPSWIAMQLSSSQGSLNTFGVESQVAFPVPHDLLIVKRNYGITDIDGHASYHYRLQIDREEFDAFAASLQTESALTNAVVEGDVWIDSQTFDVRRGSWQIEIPWNAQRVLSIQVDIHMSQQNDTDSQPALPPQQDILIDDGTLLNILQTILQQSALPRLMHSGDTP